MYRKDFIIPSLTFLAGLGVMFVVQARTISSLKQKNAQIINSCRQTLVASDNLFHNYQDTLQLLALCMGNPKCDMNTTMVKLGVLNDQRVVLNNKVGEAGKLIQASVRK